MLDLLSGEPKADSAMESLAQQVKDKPKMEQELGSGLRLKTQAQDMREDFKKKEADAKARIELLKKEIAEGETALETLTSDHSKGLAEVMTDPEYQSDKSLENLTKKIEATNSVLETFRLATAK